MYKRRGRHFLVRKMLWSGGRGGSDDGGGSGISNCGRGGDC